MAVTKITNENFETEVLQSDKPVLIDFFATWCGPCKMLSPVVDSIAEEHPEIKICKIDIDEEPSLTERFGIMSVPTLVVMKNGEIVRTSVGFKSRDAVLSLLAE
jgi:thioredoxin